MGRKLEEVTLRFDFERIRFDGSGIAILECTNIEEGSGSLGFGPNGIRVKVPCETGDLVQGLSYRFYGSWVTHPKYGKQFHAQTFVTSAPHGRQGVIRYLTQAPNIGKAYARKLWDKFGGEAVRVVRESPEVAAASIGGGFNDEKASEAAAFLELAKATEETTIDMIELLGGRGFPRNTAKKVIREFGNRAAAVVRNNPYILMRFRGCGFLRCDAMYSDMGGDPSRLKRQALCAWYSIASNTNGHTWFQPALVDKGIRERVSGTKCRPVDATKLGCRAGVLAKARDAAGGLWLTDKIKDVSESAVARRVRAFLDSPCGWPNVGSLDASEHQREKLADALVAPISTFGGGPGTGKTYSAARVIASLASKHGLGKIAVAAPTGKAAVRITEAMGSYGLDIRARTIHSLLGVESHEDGGGWGFEHNASNPLDYKYIVVDEASMIDCGLASSLMAACARGSHLLLVGDIGQLPPVGHGAPLRDLIAAGVPSGELTEVRRNSGDIVAACHAIRAGKQFKYSPRLHPEIGLNLSNLPAFNGTSAVEKIVKTIKGIGARGLVDPIWGCQVIVAVNERSELSRKSLNQKLQGELNPGGSRAKGNPFRTDDKVVCLKNGFYPVADGAPSEFNQEEEDGKVFVANGEQAAVLHVEPNRTIARLDSPSRMIVIPRSSGDGGERWDLAYAISCHKSQGSEWPVVFVVLDEYPGARMVCSREWLYTALSRARVACFTVGKPQTAYGMIARQAIAKRKTFLKERITGEMEIPRWSDESGQ